MGTLRLIQNKEHPGVAMIEGGDRHAGMLLGLHCKEIVHRVNNYARLAESHKRLREALKFYGNQANYEGPNQRDDSSPTGYRHDVTKDGGEIARAALAAASKEPKP